VLVAIILAVHSTGYAMAGLYTNCFVSSAQSCAPGKPCTASAALRLQRMLPAGLPVVRRRAGCARLPTWHHQAPGAPARERLSSPVALYWAVSLCSKHVRML